MGGAAREGVCHVIIRRLSHLKLLVLPLEGERCRHCCRLLHSLARQKPKGKTESMATCPNHAPLN
jgi:hypothetical protein